MKKMRSERLSHTLTHGHEVGIRPGSQSQTSNPGMSGSETWVYVFTSPPLFPKEEGPSLEMSLLSVLQGPGLPISACCTVPSAWCRGSDWPRAGELCPLDQPPWSGAAGAAREPLSQEGNSRGRQALCELEALPQGPAPEE